MIRCQQGATPPLCLWYTCSTTYYLSHHCIDTTGLQSSFAVMELNGSITITCTFATGATSTGCQVTIFYIMSDNLQEVMSTNITRPNGTNQVHY